MKRRGEAGLTLVELMITMVISGLVISAALGMGFSMMNSYREHRAMINVERSARVSLEIIADAIRNASPGVPLGNFEDIVGCTGQVAGLQVINNTDEPDELKLIYATGGIFTSVYQETGYAATDVTVTVIDATPEQGGGIDGQDFFADDYFIITNLESGAVVKVTDVSAPFDCGDAGTPVTCYTLTTTQPSSCGGVTWPASGYETGSLVIRGRYAHFYIEDSADTGNVPTLMMDPDADGPEPAEPIAEGIEDMQIAIGVDADADGSIAEDQPDPDDDEWYYNVDGDADPPALVPRALRITLIAMSVQEQSEVDSYTRPAAEDHAADDIKDPFRRRVLSTTIEIRNLTGSP